MNCKWALIALLVSAPVWASQAWTEFRNAPGAEAAKNLPTEWTPDRNIAWSSKVQGYGQSAPVVYNGIVFLTSIEGEMKESCLVTALDAATGTEKWKFTHKASQQGKNDPACSRAAPTSTVDKDGVYTFFESGDVIALDHGGAVRWKRSLVQDYGEFKNNHGVASSLTQNDTDLFVQVDHQGPSYLLAIKKSDGSNRWKTERKSNVSWTSPVLAGERLQYVIAYAGGVLHCYDAATGAELARVEDLAGNGIPSPVAQGNTVLLLAGESSRAAKNPNARFTCCFQIVEQPKVELKLLWDTKENPGYHASPLIHDGLVYSVSRAGVLCCRDVKTGEVVYTENLDGPVWATPFVSEGQLFFFSTNGVSSIVKTGRTFEKIATNKLWDAAEYARRKEAARKALPERPQREGGAAAAAPKGEAAPTEAGKEPAAEAPKAPAPAAAGTPARVSPLYDAVGDMVYGVAAVDATIYIRTDSGVFCVKKAK